MKFTHIQIEWVDNADDETMRVKTDELAANVAALWLPYGAIKAVQVFAEPTIVGIPEIPPEEPDV